ncbi:ribokinase [Arthrobacter sp. Soil782]|uniref:ribokinase n=1 Tax=Arthrobacter sp. Soil782 TaxID=1736410 RepID=UPI0006F9539D|nr:ribokinase [Arthrobacter sp. Soil782]KRF08679.1 ribokinase [Arthrobacter sp. Soil782]
MSTQPPGVVVVGSINADLVVTLERHPQPGETLLGRTMTVMPGGKGANQAVAAAKLGAPTTMIGAVGQDAYTDVALSGLFSAGVNTDGVQRVGATTGVAIVEVDDDGENTIVVIPGANGEVTPALVTSAADLISDAGVLVLQGEIPAASVAVAVACATGRVLINLAPVIELDRDTLLRADPLVVNEHEGALVLEQLTGAVEPVGSEPSNHAHTARALLGCGFSSVVMTLGGAGALLATSSGVLEVPAPSVAVVDTTGAGDAFVGALAARLVAGDALPVAVAVAVRVGAFAVGSEGAQPSYPSQSDALPGAATPKGAQA